MWYYDNLKQSATENLLAMYIAYCTSMTSSTIVAATIDNTVNF